jgi:hypothetical protein
MYKLTQKNYGLLPEIQKKKDQEKKKEELKQRIKNVKELEKVSNILSFIILEKKRNAQKKKINPPLF